MKFRPCTPVPNTATRSSRFVSGAFTLYRSFISFARIGVSTGPANCLSFTGCERFQRSLNFVGTTTSFTSGLPMRDTCDQPLRTLPATVTLRRSVDDQTPIVLFFAFSSAIGI